MKLSDFKNIFCINLSRRPDRWLWCKQQFQTHQINGVIRFNAIDGNDLKITPEMSMDGNMISMGYYGCLFSHLAIVRIAKQMKLSNYVVFEDDFQLHRNFNELFNKYYEQVPSDWDMIYLGANHSNGTDKISENVVKMKGSFTTHSMIIKNTIYGDLINGWSNFHEKVDIIISRLHRQHNSYCFTPNLCVQKDDFSDILNRNIVNAGYMKDDFE